jgi:hypothetical protein
MPEEGGHREMDNVVAAGVSMRRRYSVQGIAAPWSARVAGPPCLLGVEHRFERRRRPSQPIDHEIGPDDVLVAALARPIGERVVEDVAQVADLVGELD